MYFLQKRIKEQEDWTIASVADDNVLQVWQPANMIINQAISDNVDLNSIHFFVYLINMYCCPY